MNNTKNDFFSKISPYFRKNNYTIALSTILCIICGIIVGFIILLCVNPEDSFSTGLYGILLGGFEDPAKILYLATPILLTGLSVAFANKVGLFNIGAPGQFLVGAVGALYCAICLNLNWFVCLLVAMVLGFICGTIPGICKAYFNVNEVITSIMLNWILLFLGNIFVLNVPGMLQGSDHKTVEIAATSQSALPRLNINDRFSNIGIFIGIIVAIICFVVIEKTTFGFELKASGLNRDAAKYSGINTKKSIILSMGIAGALSALGGALMYLVGQGGLRYQPQRIAVPEQGFNGIPVAILANNNPIGCIIIALYISFLQVGGDAMQPEYTTEVIDFVIAAIIYFSAFSLLFKNFIDKHTIKEIYSDIKFFFKNLFKKKAEKGGE